MVFEVSILGAFMMILFSEVWLQSSIGLYNMECALIVFFRSGTMQKVPSLTVRSTTILLPS